MHAAAISLLQMFSSLMGSEVFSRNSTKVDLSLDIWMEAESILFDVARLLLWFPGPGPQTWGSKGLLYSQIVIETWLATVLPLDPLFEGFRQVA